MIANTLTSRINAVARVKAWNDAHACGTFCKVWQGLPEGLWLVAPTTSPAFVHGNAAAVHVLFFVRPVYLSNLEAVLPEVLALLAAEDRQTQAANAELVAAASDKWRRRLRSQLPVGDQD